MLALDRRALVRLQSQTNWRRAAVSFPWRRISGRSMAARPVQHLRQQMSLAARTRGRTRRTLGCYGRPPCPRRRCCGRFVSDLIVSGGRRRNEGAIATVMEQRVLTMMGGRTAMMAYRRPQQRASPLLPLPPFLLRRRKGGSNTRSGGRGRECRNYRNS